jgi:hypothetical protein
MLVNLWKAALLAALASLTGNVVWAQSACPKGGCATGGKPAYGCALFKMNGTAQQQYESDEACGECCKEAKCGHCCKEAQCGACCKDKECTKCNTGPYCTAGTCCAAQEKKCQCGKGEECCCGKKCECGKKCACAKDKGCHAAKAKVAKLKTIVVFVPTPLPMMPGYHPEMAMLPAPMPVPAPVAYPQPLPPPPAGILPPGMMPPPQTVGLPVPPITPPPPPPGCYGYSCPAASCPLNAPPTELVGAPIVLSKNNTGLETCMMTAEALLGATAGLYTVLHPQSVPGLCLNVAMGLLSGPCCCETYVKERAPAPCCQPGTPAMPAAMLLPPPTAEATACCPACKCPTGQYEPCDLSKPGAEDKIWVIASTDSDRLEVKYPNGNGGSFKKMSRKMGNTEITLSRFDDRVRVRGNELKATADRVRTDHKNRLILEGNVQLHYKRDGMNASLSGEHIELNLANGTVTARPAAQ